MYWSPRVPEITYPAWVVLIPQALLLGMVLTRASQWCRERLTR